MKSYIDTVFLEDNNIQRYQLITDFKWNDVKFTSSPFVKKIVSEMARLYKVNIIPKDPSFYGTLILYHLPENIFNLELSLDTEFGKILKPQVLLNYYFQKASDNNQILKKEDGIEFIDEKLQKIYSTLLKNGYVSFAKGVSDEILFLPIDEHMGYLSEVKTPKALCNSHFFLMEKTDRDSPYDELGTPHSLALKDGKIMLPPLNHRESLLVDNNDKVLIKNLELTDLKVKVDNIYFENNQNSIFYFRPETRVTPKANVTDIIIVSDKVVAIKKGGNSIVPMAGFVIQTKIDLNLNNTKVEYYGDCENYKFGIQVGPAMIIEGKKVTSLTCPFYKGEGIAFPSTVYPLDFDKGRAARIGLGEINEAPILIWAEGAGKLGYIKGKESCGASLKEFADYCESIGINNLVNLDGGGSAQVLINNEKELRIADRKPDGKIEAERPIPLGLII